jgi:hypothetical protein
MNMLQEQAQIYLETYLNITYYRHVAIAISYVYYKSSRFKQDYRFREKKSNN